MRKHRGRVGASRVWGRVRPPLLALLTMVLVVLVAMGAVPGEAWAAGERTMHRLYNPYSGEHFYTADAAERDDVVKAGWRYEGVGWTAPTKSNTPVYRLYSGTDHHYTMDAKERDNLVRIGWKYEGIGWYSDDAKGVPLYRQFNPYVNPHAQRNNSGSHNYTVSKAENDNLVRVGWKAEGIGWYGVKSSEPVETVYTVTFKGPDGKVLKTQKVKRGQAAQAPAYQPPAGKRFDGWDRSFTVVTADLVVTAKVSDVPPVDPSVSRGEWASILVDAAGWESSEVEDECPYSDIAGNAHESAIKCAWAHGAFPDDDSTFRPNEVADRDFAFSSAVLASGYVDTGKRLNCADAADAKHPALVAIALDEGFFSPQGGKANPKGVLTKSTADALAAKVTEEVKEPELGPEVEEVEIKDGVKEVGGASRDGETMVVPAGSNVVAGQTVVFRDADGSPIGGGKVTTVSPASDGKTKVAFEEPSDPAELCDSIHVVAKDVVPEEATFTPAEGIEVLSSEPYGMRSAKARDSWDAGWQTLKVPVKGQGDFEAKITLKIRPVISTDIDWSILGGLKYAYIAMDAEGELSCNMNVSFKKDIPLGTFDFPITPLGSINCHLPVTLNISMDGEAHVTYEIRSSNSITYKGSTKAVKKQFETDVDLVERSISAEVRAIVSSDLMLRAFWSASVVDAGFDIGAGGSGSMTERANGMVCNDLNLYKYLAAYFAENTGYLKKLGVNKTWIIWDKDLKGSSLYKGHLEDGAVVSECTWKAVVQTNVPGGYMGAGPSTEGETECHISSNPSYNNALGVYDSLERTFYLYPGDTFSFEMNDYSGQYASVTAHFEGDPGTIVRRDGILIDCCGIIENNYINHFNESTIEWNTNKEAKIEVLSGRVRVNSLNHSRRGTITYSRGKCETIPYPLEISASDVTMPVGCQYKLEYEWGISEKLGNGQFEMVSDDDSIAKVSEEGLITARKPGTTIVRCRYPKYSDGPFERYCIVTVK